LNENLLAYENALENRFFGGATPGMTDYMLWPWFERFPILKSHGFVLNDDGKLPKLAAWVQAMESDEAVTSIKIPEKSIQLFIESVQQNQNNYDIE
jgi:glutathione S-transferase